MTLGLVCYYLIDGHIPVMAYWVLENRAGRISPPAAIS